MRIEQLYYFKEVAYAKSITLASQHLFISQQSLSDAIAKLESEFHLHLFDRTKKGVLLTYEGEQFLGESLKILAIYENCFALSLPKNNPSPTLRIASDRHFNNAFFNHIMAIYKKRIPHVQLRIQEELWTLPIVSKVINQEVDLGIATTHDALLVNDPLIQAHLNKTFTIHPLALDNLYAIVSKHCPLGQQKTVTMDEVLHYPLAIDNDPNLIAILKNSSNLYQPDILMTSNSQQVQLQAVQENLAIGFANGLSLKYGNFDLLNTCSVPIEQAIVKMVALIPIDQKKAPEITSFLNLFEHYLSH